MSNPVSLAFLTLPHVPVCEAVRIAAETGFDGIGLRLLPAAPGEPHYPIYDDAETLREIQAILRDTGLAVFDAEIVRLKPETDVTDFLSFLERAAALGARNVLVAGDDPDEARLTDRFAAFCALAADHGLTGDLEFMPWTKVPDLRTARRVVEAAGAPNGAVLVDALHFDRAGVTLDELRALPSERTNYVQFCDGPADYDRSDEGLIRVARGARLFPGEGAIDLAGIARCLPPGVPVSVEVPNLARDRHVPPTKIARHALASARAILDRAKYQPTCNEGSDSL